MTITDVLLALAFVWLVLAIEWPGERDEEAFLDDGFDDGMREVS